MKLSSDRDILQRLHELGPFPDDGAAIAALHGTLRAVSGGLTEDERKTVAASLPPDCARVVLEARSTGCRTSGDLFLDLSLQKKMTLARAVEYAEIAGRALGEVLSPTVHARLRHALPDIAKLFEPFAEEAAPLPRPLVAAPTGLARDRPRGSVDPAEVAHEHSVARSDDPHAETKLSSARGLTQERERRTLATGRPDGGHSPCTPRRS